MLTRYSDISAFITKDGSEIRELLHPNLHGNRNQSLAEAIVYPDQQTRLHKHHTSEELYHITQGTGIMTLGNEQFPVKSGDTICISPATPHCIKNIGTDALHILCCCSPAYSDTDTELL